MTQKLSHPVGVQVVPQAPPPPATRLYFFGRFRARARRMTSMASASRYCSPHDEQASTSTVTVMPSRKWRSVPTRPTRRDPHCVHVRTGASLVGIARGLRRDEEVVDFFPGFARDFTLRVEERSAVTKALDDIKLLSDSPTTWALRTQGLLDGLRVQHGLERILWFQPIFIKLHEGFDGKPITSSHDKPFDAGQDFHVRPILARASSSF